MAELYKKRTFLLNQYLDRKKSSNVIAREAGVSQYTIKYWLNKFSITLRDREEAARMAKEIHVAVEGDLLEFLIGGLLGDGSLDHITRRSSSFYWASKHKGVTEWISNQLARLGVEQCGRILKTETDAFLPPGKIFHVVSYRYQTRYYIELGSLQKRWYRPPTDEERQRGRKAIKIVPQDLKLTPLACLLWYLGDGWLNVVNGSTSSHFATQSFTTVEIDFLIDLLKGLGIKATRWADKTLKISATTIKNFFNFIGPCPREIKGCLGYRWPNRRCYYS